MKTLFAAIAALLIYAPARSQQFVLDSIKTKHIYGLTCLNDEGLGIVYRDADKQVVMTKLDRDLKVTSTAAVALDLKPKDIILETHTNGTTILFKINRFTGNFRSGVAAQYPSMDDTYEVYYTTLNLNNTVAGTLKGKDTYIYSDPYIMTDSTVNGYYFVTGNTIFRLDNTLKIIWQHKAETSSNLRGGVNSLGGANLFGYNSKGFYYLATKRKSPLSGVVVSEKVIKLSVESGAVEFEYNVDITAYKTNLELIVDNGFCHVVSMIGSYGTKTGLPKALNWLVLDNDGKIVRNNAFTMPGFNNLICTEKEVVAYYRGAYVNNKTAIVVFEKSKANEYTVFKLSGDSTIEYKTLEREKSDLHAETNPLLLMFSWGGYNMNKNKLFTSDYEATLPIDSTNNLFGIIYDEITKDRKGNLHQYHMTAVNFAVNTVTNDQLLGVYKRLETFMVPSISKAYTYVNTTGRYVLLAYTPNYNQSFIVNKIRF